jgi:hypothetical protein
MTGAAILMFLAAAAGVVIGYVLRSDVERGLIARLRERGEQDDTRILEWLARNGTGRATMAELEEVLPISSRRLRESLARLCRDRLVRHDYVGSAEAIWYRVDGVPDSRDAWLIPQGGGVDADAPRNPEPARRPDPYVSHRCPNGHETTPQAHTGGREWYCEEDDMTGTYAETWSGTEAQS